MREGGWGDYVIMNVELKSQVWDGMSEHTWIEEEWGWQNRTIGKISGAVVMRWQLNIINLTE